MKGNAKFRIQGFSLGNTPPIIEKIDTHSFLPDNTIQLDVYFYYCPQKIFQLVISSIPFTPPVPVKLSNLIMRGKSRIVVALNGFNPGLSEIKFSLIETPKKDFKIAVSKFFN